MRCCCISSIVQFLKAPRDRVAARSCISLSSGLAGGVSAAPGSGVAGGVSTMYEVSSVVVAVVVVVVVAKRGDTGEVGVVGVVAGRVNPYASC